MKTLLLLILFTFTCEARIKLQRGYIKKNGRYVAPHLKTTPNKTTWDNLKPKQDKR